MITVFDTETSGFLSQSLPFEHPNQGRIMSIAALLLDEQLEEVSHFYTLIDIPDHVFVNEGAFKAHGIPKEACKKYGISIENAIRILIEMFNKSRYRVGHNLKFDMGMIHQEWTSLTQMSLTDMDSICTMEVTTDICKLPFSTHSRRAFGQKYKWPKLEEAVKHLLGETMEGAHDALVDVRYTAKLFKYLWQEGYLDKYKNPSPSV